MLKFYDKLGYSISQVHIDDEVVKSIADGIDAHQKELDAKIAKAKKEQEEKGELKDDKQVL